MILKNTHSQYHRDAVKKVIEETESLAGGRYSNAKDDVRVDATASTVSTGSIAALQLEVWYSSTWRLDVAMNHEFSTRVRVGRRLNRLATERGGIQKIEFRTHSLPSPSSSEV